MSTDRPTRKQQELLQYIGEFIREHGYGPSYREIMNGMNYKSVSTVAVHVDGLIARGWLPKKTHSARSLEITSPHTSPAVTTTAAPVDPERSTEEVIMAAFDTAWKQKDIAPTDREVLVEALRVLGYTEQYETYQQKLNRHKKIAYNEEDEISNQEIPGSADSRMGTTAP